MNEICESELTSVGTWPL